MKGFYFILGSTFIMGFIAGMFVFFVSQPPAPIIDDTDDDFGPQQFEIIADVYGGCSLIGCPSYKISADGSYEYIEATEESTKFEGRLSRQQIAQLEETVLGTNLDQVEDTTFTGTCPIAFDGPAYQYTIFVENTSHRIDTCEQVVSGSVLFVLLEEYFSIFGQEHQE